MAEEFPARRVDPVGAAAVIDLVEIEFEDLVLRKLPFERKRQDALAEFAPELLLVVEEDGARKLLRDRRSTLRPVTAIEPHLHRARDADRIETDMRSEAAIFDRHGRVAHHLGNLAVRQPLAEARPHRHDHGAVGGMDADHLAVGGRLQAVETGELRHRDIDRDRQRTERENTDPDHDLEKDDQPPPPA